jgi:hypothetical protein
VRSLTLALAAILVAAPNTTVAEPRLIGWSDLRPAGDFECAVWHELSRSLEICEGVPQDPGYRQCASRTNPVEGAVTIAGYAHPVEIEFEGVRRFLLMPALVPCRHPPPPMANQIILVEYPPGLDMSFDPFFVTGTLTAEVSLEVGIQAHYRMQATAVSPATHPDVTD